MSTTTLVADTAQVRRQRMWTIFALGGLAMLCGAVVGWVLVAHHASSDRQLAAIEATGGPGGTCTLTAELS